MKKTLKRIVSTCVSVALLATTMVTTAVPSSAISYSGSSSYKSGKYYRALTAVKKTGNQRTDVVNVALSQVGYQESGSSSKLSGEVRGSGNYTEYGRWYGVHTMWCAMYVSWCTAVAGVSTSISPKHSFTPTGVNWFINRGRAYTRAKVAAGNYTPQKGDIIYFKSSRNQNIVNHVGIVRSYSGRTVYTVEGNSSSATISTNGGACVKKSYSITNTYIRYICKPAYNGTSISTGTSSGGSTSTPSWSGGKGSSHTGKYYPKYTGSSGSLVTALNAKNIDSSKAFRAVIAKKNGITNYSYTPAQNTEMLNKLKKGTLLNPDYKESSSGGGSTTVTSTGTYFTRYTGSTGSIVTALNAIGVDSSKAHRAKIAAVNGITNYSYTPEQNIEMLNKLKKGTLIKPSCCGGSSSGTTTTTTPTTSTSKSYFPQYTGSTVSIVTALNAIGVDSSKAHRLEIAKANGISDYSYTPDQNTELLNLLKKGKLVKPACCK